MAVIAVRQKSKVVDPNSRDPTTHFFFSLFRNVRQPERERERVIRLGREKAEVTWKERERERKLASVGRRLNHVEILSLLFFSNS